MREFDEIDGIGPFVLDRVACDGVFQQFRDRLVS